MQVVAPRPHERECGLVPVIGTPVANPFETGSGEIKAMLRITRTVGDDAVEFLKLEGMLRGPWVREARWAHALAASKTSHICLDLSGLFFADEEGAALLLQVIRSGTKVVGCTPYIAELLQTRAGSRQV
jgi:hypothetical protein